MKGSIFKIPNLQRIPIESNPVPGVLYRKTVQSPYYVVILPDNYWVTFKHSNGQGIISTNSENYSSLNQTFIDDSPVTALDTFVELLFQLGLVDSLKSTYDMVLRR